MEFYSWTATLNIERRRSLHESALEVALTDVGRQSFGARFNIDATRRHVLPV